MTFFNILIQKYSGRYQSFPQKNPIKTSTFWCNNSSTQSFHFFQATAMAGEDDFCENYIVIKPEEASCFDLVRILCSKDLENRDFFKTRVEGGVIGFRHRWIVFISVLLQKAFLYLKKPMAAVGSALELWLNYPPSNGGYCHLFFNVLTGFDFFFPLLPS